MNKINKQNRNGLTDQEHTDSYQREGGSWEWVKKAKGLSKKHTQTNRQKQKTIVSELPAPLI